MTQHQTSAQSLPATAARWTCPDDAFPMSPLAVPEDLQLRAMTAARFALGAGSGFHLVVVGPSTTDRAAFMHRLLRATAAERPVSSDWVYVMRFETPDAPRALELPAGQGREFKAAIAELVADLRAEVPRAYEAALYEQQRDAILAGFAAQRDNAFEQLRRHASDAGFALMETPQGIAITPLMDGKPVAPEVFATLEPAVRARYDAGRAALSDELDSTSRTIRDLQRGVRERLRELDQAVASEIVGQRVAETRDRFLELPALAGWLQTLQQDAIDNIGMFRGGEPEVAAAAGMNPMAVEEFFRRYAVNIIVDRANERHAPVVVESNPTYANLIGAIERRGVMGTLVTDFSMIKGGSLLRANGGFLLVELRDLLAAPFAWNGLKTALQERAVHIEDPGQAAGMISTAALEPEAIPLRVNVVLLADAPLAASVTASDPEFNRHFKIRAEFQDSVERTPEHLAQLAGYLLDIPSGGMPELDVSGVARLLEQAARLAGDQRRLSVELERLADIAREAMQLAATAGTPTTGRETVRQAIAARSERSRYVNERLQALLVDQTILIDTDGEAVGQINGLEVLSVNPDQSFGKPVRITARTFAGTGGVVNIDREVELGGPIHSKSVLILNGYLGGQYGRKRPLSLAASVVFEQTYQPVEGDSASLAELFTLLSSLANAPLKQSLAITGSVNQHGQVQAIGGINEKVEGFFDLCIARGLTGTQGVVFPHANVHHLMLREDVVAAIAAGNFHLWPIETVEQGIELFTGVEAGVADAEGEYPPDSLHGRVSARLVELSEAARRWEHVHERVERGDGDGGGDGPHPTSRDPLRPHTPREPLP